MAFCTKFSANLILNNFKKCFLPLSQSQWHKTNFHYASIDLNCYEEKDPAPLFFKSNVQELLKNLTGLDLDKVFQQQQTLHGDEVPEFKFLTDEQLKQEMELSLAEARKSLQMPPVVQVHIPNPEILSEDPAIQGSETSNIIFTDISVGLTDRNRLVVVREPSGRLRKANWEERSRMNRIYNPRPRRYVNIPSIFNEAQLKDAMSREEYRFVLDFACVQFDPEDPDFHRVTSTLYDDIDINNRYDTLHSTRYYGPFCFYLSWNSRIDNLLSYYIERERLEEGASLIQLYGIMHNKEHLIKKDDIRDSNFDLIKTYTTEGMKKNPTLNLAVLAYEELIRKRQEDELEQTKIPEQAL